MFSGKLKSRWSRPFTIAHVFPYGTVELSQNSRPNFKETDIEEKDKNKAKNDKTKHENGKSMKQKSKSKPGHLMGELRLAMLWLDRRYASVECTIRVYVKVYVPRIVMPCPFSLLIHPMRMQLLDGVRGYDEK
ncbi:hypothetical protein Tco_0952203 [Tanacetum coccineum]|uniref:Uncharacterized protein n=1 Tax=Tanacetum coccineum TaxID=301880 RepID=A0ABQ5DY62_9ASTR